ncbi:MAG: nucleotidyltransferase family protein, partial [bacterium]|nr:nucleotidyltransferase family protein [bacterium]
GISYPKAISLLSNNINKPNDLLAISYIKSIIINNYSITPISIKRTNDYHGKDYITNNIISGTTIRTMYNNNEDIDKYLPTKDYLIKVNDQKIFTLLKYQILTNINCLAKFLSVDEGLDYRIKKNIYNSTNLEDLIAKVKTKRYTYNRLKRMFTHILLSLTKEEIKYNKKLEYIKILGFNEQGRKYLHSIKKEIKLPIIYGYQKNLSKSLDIDFRIKSIYSYIVNDTSIIENELNKKPIYKN